MRDAPLSLLWLIDLEPSAGMQHGGALRWFNFSRELMKRGHDVCFSVNQEVPEDVEAKRVFLDRLRKEGCLGAYAETHYHFPRRLGKVAHLLAYPALTNIVLHHFQTETTRALEGVLSERRVDGIVISDRRLLFVAPRLQRRVPVVLDWSDSFTLYEWRQTVAHCRARKLGRLPRSLKRLGQAFLQERYYGRRAGANVVVSPVDLAVLNRITGRPEAGRLLLNGAELATQPLRSGKVPGRLIFTGVMSFPPNVDAAIWFIDHVLPLITARRPDTRLVVVGRDPVPELRRRAGDHVTVMGPVSDIRQEIGASSLYVAPLVSGGGFKNKVVEALGAGTFVAGTSMAMEFLPDDMRSKLLVGDTPAELADRVLSFLGNPGAFEERLPGLRQTLLAQYTWARRTDELLRVIRSAIADWRR